MSMPDFAMNCLNTILIIISFCTIFNFISLICSEITVATTISMLLFIAMFIAQGAFAITATASPYIIHFDTEGNEIITQELDPRYPGDAKVKMAKTDRGHFLTEKRPSRKRKLRKGAYLSGKQAKNIKKMVQG